MRTVQVIKTGISTIWKGVKNKCSRVKTHEIIAENKSVTAQKDLPMDEFICTASKQPKTLISETAVEASEVSKKTPVSSRPITDMEKWNFREYLLGKRVDLKITPQEIKTLFSYEGEEFRLKSLEFLCSKMNIPKEVQPKLVYGQLLSKNMLMNYDFTTNIINVNINMNELFSNKNTFLILLRHELQHYLQSMSIFRHETIGKEFAEYLPRLKSKILDNRVKYVNFEEIKPMFNEQELKEIEYLMNLLKNNKTAEYDDYIKKSLNNDLAAFSDFRKTIIDKMGIIKKESAEGKRAEKMYETTKWSAINPYVENNGNFNLAQYYTDIREVEAIAAQDMISLRLNAILSGNDKYCYLKTINDAQKLIKEHADELDPQLKEVVINDENIKIEDLKQKLSYLFD